jgi:hypothetical protein
MNSRGELVKQEGSKHELAKTKDGQCLLVKSNAASKFV